VVYEICEGTGRQTDIQTHWPQYFSTTQASWARGNKYVRLRQRSYIHTCRFHAWPVRTPASWLPRIESLAWCELYHTICSLGSHGAGNADDPSDFGLLGELLGVRSSSKWEIPCLGRRRIVMQNLTPLALSSAEKSITVQTNKKRTNSKRYIHTLPIGM